MRNRHDQLLDGPLAVALANRVFAGDRIETALVGAADLFQCTQAFEDEVG